MVVYTSPAVFTDAVRSYIYVQHRFYGFLILLMKTACSICERTMAAVTSLISALIFGVFTGGMKGIVAEHPVGSRD